MKERIFESWRAERKHGAIAWIIKSTIIATSLYILFHVVIGYPSSEAVSILDFINQEIVMYLIFPCIMFFLNWGTWLYRESQFKKERIRRNLG